MCAVCLSIQQYLSFFRLRNYKDRMKTPKIKNESYFWMLEFLVIYFQQRINL